MPETIPNPDQPLLSLDDVSRRFAARTVVNRVTLSVDAGEVHLIVGPNGSGKTTLARLAAGLLRPHAGDVRVAGADPRVSPAARRLLGYAGHESQLYSDLTPLHNLVFAARLQGRDNPALDARAALVRFDVDPASTVPVRRLSRGFVQRVALARSLVHGPRLLIWDEPLTGLDAASVARTVAVLEGLRREGTAVLLISHDLPALWALGARAHVLHGGEIAESAGTDEDLAAFQSRYAALTG